MINNHEAANKRENVLNWKNYQEKVADFFRSLGLDAETDATVQGVRTKHNVDVLVKSHHAGFDVTWIIECKHWKSKVSKLHVLALREIVQDTGADRGILLAEKGFQSGAIEAANLTNVQVTSLENVGKSASTAINSMKLRDLFDRSVWCKKEYWDIPKAFRVESGLRPGLGYGVGYSGDWVVKAVEDLISKGFRGDFPCSSDETLQIISEGVMGLKMPKEFLSLLELIHFIETLIVDLEKRINECKMKFGI
ncbi:restriction endonuclease [uncultured Rheinheimera sp.]|uniref:restriction endonuclease n=1 Tax=uncultured Rheinheimera sp. TaxID=400532 RepID=UPI002591F336|nr:restriction endonuclease [uncultured Rheinheimera sp.]